MNKCPACGYHLKSNPNIGKEMNKILKSKNKRTVKMLNKIASMITSEIPSETRYKYYQFLYGTKNIEDNVMEWAVQTYYEGQHIHQGKGFAYLRSIAMTRGENVQVIKQKERQRLGSVPPLYKGE
jgi:transcriptional regulator CtsR